MRKILHFLKSNSAHLFAAILWFFSIKRFFTKDLLFAGDSAIYFMQIKNYLDSVARGVFPGWDPFYFWGRLNNLDVRFIGEYNPFLYIISLFRLLGFSFSLSYFIYLVICAYLGLLGFFLLAKRIFKDEVLAYLAFFLLMFSFMWATLFNDLAVVLIFNSSVWFFYFLVAFGQSPSKANFLGLTFSCMIIAITYIPFYFLTLFLLFLIFFPLLYGRHSVSSFQTVMNFIRRNKFLTLFCLVSLILSLLPGLMWFLSAGGDQYMVGPRHSNALSNNVASVSYFTASAGGVVAFSIEKLFAHLNAMTFGDMYVPVFFYLILLMCLFVKISKKQVLFFAMGLSLVVISLTDLTPVHYFLFKYVFFFKYFRNLIYLAWMAVPLFILFAVEQFRLLCEWKTEGALRKISALILVIIVHLGFFLFLKEKGGMMITTIFSIAGSFLLFVLLLTGIIKIKTKGLALALLLVVALQPMEVFYYLSENCQKYMMDTSQLSRYFKPEFIYVRPKETGELDFLDSGVLRDLEDTSGFPVWFRKIKKFTGTKYTWQLQKMIPESYLREYASHKFVIYDQIKHVGKELEKKELASSLAGRENVAFVFDTHKDILEKYSSSIPKFAKYATQASDSLRVEAFDYNFIRIKTNFAVEKFLVYNDSFHKGWQVFISGERKKIYRTNVAFKGIWVPKGENIIEFRFASPWKYAFDWFLLIYFFAFLFALFVVIMKEKNSFCHEKTS